MPELPEIAILARDMRRELIGKEITGIEVLQPKCLNLPTAEFVARLQEARIVDVFAHGKWLKVETSRGWLLLNLGMGGEVLLVNRQGLPQRWRIVFDFADGTCLAVNFWWFGYAHYASDPAQHPMVGRLGPHALDLSLEQFQALLEGRRGAIKSFLLDQERIAGIGNVYVQDPLFKARLHPLRAIPSLTCGEISALWQALRETLQQSIDHGGAAYELNLYGVRGGWDEQFLLVGYREGSACPACGATIVKIRTGSTASYICPVCQPLP
jgi:formamidopyrimidine-DNA glycosylase